VSNKLKRSDTGLSDQLVEKLGLEIASGKITEGTVLTSTHLEALYGVSRTVVREALQILHNLGLTLARTKLGTVVLNRREWNLLDSQVIHWCQVAGDANALMSDFSEVRYMYEMQAARLAARKRGTSDLTKLNASLKNMRDAFFEEGPESNKLHEAHLDFHNTILEATQNEFMARLSILFTPMLRLRFEIVNAQIKIDGTFLLRHRSLVDAITESDEDAAEKAMSTLLDISHKEDLQTLRKED
jgi:DNA-binding FadR family transcriptional regulator